jgi:ankyrin repeat protein
MKPRLIFWVGAIFFTLFMSLKYSTLSDKDHQSALHLATWYGYKEIVECLLEHGAKVDLLSRWNIFLTLFKALK